MNRESMNTHPANIIVDSCQYTPVYLVQDTTGAIQGRSYIITQGNVEDAKPVTDNLKRFYENSGIYENNLGSNVANITKPRILKRQDGKLMGNNVKLASLLLPKTVNYKIPENYLGKQCVPVNNVILKPTKVAPSVINTVSKVEVSRKIVKLKDFPNALKTTPREKIAPKIKPKEDVPNNIPTKHTSVQLLKLGETYHSLNQLSGDQMKMVNQAMKIFNNSEKTTTSEPTYDPVTNTCFMYNVVSPKDITLVGKNKIVIKNKKEEIKKEFKKFQEKEIPKPEPVISEEVPEPPVEIDITVVGKNKIVIKNKKEFKKFQEKEIPKAESVIPEEEPEPLVEKDIIVVGKNKFVIKNKKEFKKLQEKEIPNTEPDFPEEELELTVEEIEPPVEVKTRSGRKVKFPKQMVPEETPHKPKKKTVAAVSCFQCASEFCSLYRLQKHYENHPTHIPAKIHSNLFHCLLAIIKSGSEEDRAKIFIQQLEQLIEKLKSLLPCLMKKIDGSEGKSCTINDDIGRLFGMNPGLYYLNMEALTCVKDKDGYCRHNPPKSNELKSDPNTPSQLWHSNQNDEVTKLENETEDCARISSVDKWPTAQKRLNNSKLQKTQQLKRKKLASECQVQQSIEPKIEFDIEDLVNFGTNHDQSAINMKQESLSLLENLDLDVGNENPVHQPILGEHQSNIDMLINQTKKTTGIHNQFHSTHFDIRSSPIKSSASIFHKFQINPEKLGKYDVQIIRPMALNHDQDEITKDLSSESMPSIVSNCNTPDLQSIFRDDLQLQLSPCKEPSGIPPELTYDTSKGWIIEAVNDKSNESFLKSNNVVQPSLLHVQPSPLDNLEINNLVNSTEMGDNENHLLSSRSSSVFNFLETLSNECLSYPVTEFRNNPVENVDFQLDLFSFSNT